MTSYPGTSPVGGGLHCMVGFIAGEAAQAVGSMRQSEVVRKALAQLDTMFGAPSWSKVYALLLSYLAIRLFYSIDTRLASLPATPWRAAAVKLRGVPCIMF